MRARPDYDVDVVAANWLADKVTVPVAVIDDGGTRWAIRRDRADRWFGEGRPRRLSEEEKNRLREEVPLLVEFPVGSKVQAELCRVLVARGAPIYEV